MQTSVENVVGGQAGDTLTGDDDRNVLTGNGGPDRLSGGIGADDLIGNAGGDRLFGEVNADLLSGLDGADELVGGPGVDRFFGGADGDVIDARDGLIENQISCGEGATTGRDDDLLTIDLRDAVPADCESVQQFATDDGPPGRALPQRLRVRRGATVAVKLGCPRTARVTCRGVLTLRPPGGGRALARGRYRVRLGGRASVSLTIRRPSRQRRRRDERAGRVEEGPALLEPAAAGGRVATGVGGGPERRGPAVGGRRRSADPGQAPVTIAPPPPTGASKAVPVTTPPFSPRRCGLRWP